jgi:hypothetical protein
MEKKYNGKVRLIIGLVTLVFAAHSSVADSLSKTVNQQILLNSYVEESSIPLNGNVILHIEVSWPGKLNRYQIEPVSQPILTNLLLEGSGSENRLLTGEDGSLKAVKAITYRLRPLEMGMAYIDGIVLRYIDRESGEEENLSSQRIMVEILEPIPENKSERFQAVVYIVLLIIFFVITTYFILKYFRKKKSARENGTPEISLAETYLNRLSQEVDPRGTNLSDMISRLSKIFREYLHQDLHIPAKELSTQEIVASIKNMELDESEINSLTQVFEKLDIIKFSGKSMDPNEFTHIYGTIENFLMKRKQQDSSLQASAKEES